MTEERTDHSKWSRFEFWWMTLSPIKFIVFTNLLMVGLTLLLTPVMVMLGYDENTEIGGPDFGDLGPVMIVVAAVLVAPVIETLLFQYPVLWLKKWVNVYLLMFFSAALFALAHSDYSMWYALIVFPMGVVLAYIIVNYKHPVVSGFWITVLVHAFRNSVAMIPYFLME